MSLSFIAAQTHQQDVLSRKVQDERSKSANMKPVYLAEFQERLVQFIQTHQDVLQHNERFASDVARLCREVGVDPFCRLTTAA